MEKKQFKALPQEYLADIENYIGYVLYQHKKDSVPSLKHDGSKHFGSIKMQHDVLTMQKELRDEWIIRIG